MDKIKQFKIFDASVLKRYLLYLIPLLVVANIAFSIVYKNELEILEHRIKAHQYEEVSILSFVINQYFDQIYDDLNLVYRSNEFQDYMAHENDENLMGVIDMFERFMKSKDSYVQLRYIDEEGMEIARVDQVDKNVVIIENLQDKSDRYYFKSASKLFENQMYISNFDLNVEFGEIVLPYQPVIRFALPVIKNGSSEGIIIINIDGKQFLSILDYYQKRDLRIVSTGIFDSQNFWWFANMSAYEKDVLDLMEIEDLFDGEIETQLLSRKSSEFNIDRTYFVTVYLESNADKRYIFEKGYPFGLLSSYSVEDAIRLSGNPFLESWWMRYLMSLVLALLAWQMTLYFYNKEAEQLMIFASGYISLFTYDGVVITDCLGKLIFCNSVYENILGYTLEELKSQTDRALIFRNPESRLRGRGNYEQYWEGHVWDKTKNGTHIFKHLRIKAIKNKYHKSIYYVGIFSNPILDTADILFEKEFWRNYYYIRSDCTTFESIMTQYYSETSRIAILAIKISDLNMIKHAIYQEDISMISEVISSHIYQYLSKSCEIAFVAEDLIVIALQLAHEENAVVKLMERIDAVFYALRISESNENSFGYFIGLSLSPEHGEDISTLLSNAFISLEALTKIKMARYLVFDSQLFEVAQREIKIHDAIEKAFRDREFHTVYQVQKRFVTEEITGVEALIRWNSSQLGYLLPKEFLEIIEGTEYVKSIAKYVLREVIDDYLPLKELLPENFRISLNLTGAEFMDEKLIDELLDMISESPLDKELFCFEITESTLIESLSITNDIIAYLHDHQIKVAIDDFGTGYSSLSYLKDLKADKLKIDRAFIKDYPERDNGAMLKAIIRLTQELNIESIIEGVETYEQHLFCLVNGYQEYQGYYGSKPVEISEIREMITSIK